MRTPWFKPLRFIAAAVALTALAAWSPVLADDKGRIGAEALRAAGALLDQLKSAKDTGAEIDLIGKIWEAWTVSGDAQVDTLMHDASIGMQVGSFDEALAILDSIVAKAPNFAEAWNKRATLLYMMKQYDRSLTDIDRVLALEPRHFGAISGQGMIHTIQGNKAAALKAYQRVLEIDPQNVNAKQWVVLLQKMLEGNPT